MIVISLKNLNKKVFIKYFPYIFMSLFTLKYNQLLSNFIEIILAHYFYNLF